MKGGYFTALPANRDRLGGLQLLGRLAALQGVTDQCPAFAVLPGATPGMHTIAVDREAGVVTVEIVDAQPGHPE